MSIAIVLSNDVIRNEVLFDMLERCGFVLHPMLDYDTKEVLYLDADDRSRIISHSTLAQLHSAQIQPDAVLHAGYEMRKIKEIVGGN